MAIDAESAKIEANALIAIAYIECTKYLNKAQNILVDADVPPEEISKFMNEQKGAAKMLVRAYFRNSR